MHISGGLKQSRGDQKHKLEHIGEAQYNLKQKPYSLISYKNPLCKSLLLFPSPSSLRTMLMQISAQF